MSGGANGPELPPVDGRWTASRKQAVVNAIARGFISAELALERYGLSAGELRTWRTGLRLHGPAGLAANKLRELRPVSPRRPSTA